MRKIETENRHKNTLEFQKRLTLRGMGLAVWNVSLLVVCTVLCVRKWMWIFPVAAVSLAGNLWIMRSLGRIYARSIGSISQENDSIRLNLKNARLSALVSQLNPHFLFNVFQLLQDEIVNGTKENSCRIVTALSNMFRYSSLNTEAVVRLEEEIRFAEDYLSICEQVYEGNLTTEVRVPEALYDYTVPKFILQPVLENSIKHGFGSAPYKNTICISVRKEESQLLVEICDDGKGVTPEQLQKMNDAIQTASGENKNGRIGLRNVHQRIRLICGEPYGITLEACDPRGLRVTLRIPHILT